MKTSVYRALFLSLILLSLAPLAAKKPLDHDAFDSWCKLKNYAVSRDGVWAAFATLPLNGDDTLYLRNLKSGKEITVPRGYNPVFSADGKWAVALVKPLFADARQARIDGKKDLKAPQDSLAVVNLLKGSVEMIPNVKSFATGEKGGDWMAYVSVDTIHTSASDLAAKDAGKPLVIRRFDGKVQKVVKWVNDFCFSKNGAKLALTVRKPDNDSVFTNGVGVMALPDTAFYLVDRDKAFYGRPVFDETGTQLAYTTGNDSVKSGTKKLQLFRLSTADLMREPEMYNVEFLPSKGRNLRKPGPSAPGRERLLREWEERMQASADDGLYINQYAVPEFSYDGRRLVIGVAPYVAPDDTTIVDFERADLDIWRWDAPYTPPQSAKLLKQMRENQYPVVIDIATGNWVLTTDRLSAVVSAPNRWDGDWALVQDPTDNLVEQQWNYIAPEALTLVNVISGERRYLGKAQTENSLLSPADRYVVWYKARNYYAYNIATGDTVCLSREIPFPLWDEEDDRPLEKQPYGIMGWADGDEWVFVYDRFDVWGVDPSGRRSPFCLTAGEGRKSGRRFRLVSTDPDRRWLSPGSLLLFSVFDLASKEQGLATARFETRPSAPVVRLLEGASFTQILKAKEADSFTWQRASFDIAPDIWGVTSLNFSKALQLTAANPQMKDYSWGTPQLFKWYAYDGKPAEGILYLPEDFSPDKSYPMLTVFYEIGSNNLYTHYPMEPSWSWVNYPFYVSRGYVVFVPDIHYTAGVPGESAYNYVCSGVEAVCDMYPNIDRSRLGIDGQSWGGYQVAYLITRTDMFACAGSGAPVANMTSAFGGIRWETGSSRQAQYEQGQSRIGRNLWDAPELYMANSPVFHADRVHTPLLIMHNDADGAVPWYQGIELFMALRRLRQPVWMLQYNGEAHNIKDKKNRRDITVRLQQFFDHYLMDAPMPRWMSEGIDPLRKGQDMGY